MHPIGNIRYIKIFHNMSYANHVCECAVRRGPFVYPLFDSLSGAGDASSSATSRGRTGNSTPS